ncbi:MAG: 50S ribosome-binding GTPase [Gammaproteobacteria bacterium]|nr:50S ribosome-binding GTPase [Gammaproteobacteria bacterium]
MNQLFEQQHQQLERWSASAVAEGWLATRDIDRLREIERQQAEAIFSRKGQRPLIVAFFGGTGVGKSTLLNRLAGESIARTGVERPTSHEVTLYLHGDYRLGEFPADLPVDETRIAYHSDDRRRLIAWLDMPDFDSVEEHHRELVQAWLPYVDWIIYVVSPGRYQDDIGWRIVQHRGGKHSWLFVMNQWDQGHDEQIAHFRARLQQEGFSDPVIMRTSCIDPKRSGEDDFNLLEQTVNNAIQTYGLEQLQQLGVQARVEELQRVSEAFINKLKEYPLDELETAWRETLSESLAEVKEALLTNSRLLAGGFQEESGLPWRAEKKGAGNRLGKVQPAALLAEIWSSRIATRLSDLSGELENLLQRQNVPAVPFAPWLQRLREDSQGEFLRGAEGPCANALLQPGSAVRRGVWRAAGWLSWGLPMAASGWAVYHLVIRFYQGTRGEAGFLGLDFAIHATLLIVLSWLLPWLLQRKLKPTVSDAIIQALAIGADAGMKRIEAEGVVVLAAADEARDRCVAGVAAIHQALQTGMAAMTTKLPWTR